MEGEYRIRITRHAQASLRKQGLSTRRKVRQSIELLAAIPDIGRDYNPEYDAALPPTACKSKPVPGTHICLYYVIDEDLHAVAIIAVEDDRMDPEQRFGNSL